MNVIVGIHKLHMSHGCTQVRKHGVHLTVVLGYTAVIMREIYNDEQTAAEAYCVFQRKKLEIKWHTARKGRIKKGSGEVECII